MSEAEVENAGDTPQVGVIEAAQKVSMWICYRMELSEFMS